MREAPLLLGIVLVVLLGCWVVSLQSRVQAKAVRLAELEQERRELKELGRLYLEEGAWARNPVTLLKRARELGLDLVPPALEQETVGEVPTR